MMDSSSFGLRLRQCRERRGTSLEQIAGETKINQRLLADLERGDLSRWPAGVFGRAFIRSYAEAIGLEPRAVVAEFLGLLPGDEGASPLSPRQDAEPRRNRWTFEGSRNGSGPALAGRTGFRLTFAEARVSGLSAESTWKRRLVASAVDTAILFAGAVGGQRFLGSDGWIPGLALTAVATVILASTVLGTTPGRLVFGRVTHLQRPGRPRRDGDGRQSDLVGKRESSQPASNGRA
jgi:transcriptional regulator with XRE-family HTH domain